MSSRKSRFNYHCILQILPKGLILPHSEGSKKENNAKNRYLETWPCKKLYS